MLVPEAYERLLSAVFGDSHSPAFPDTWFIALLDENGDELTGTGYARVPVDNTSEAWAIEDGVASNLEPIEVGIVEEDDWAEVHAVALLDENGDQVFVSELDDPFVAVEGFPVGFDAASLAISTGA